MNRHDDDEVLLQAQGHSRGEVPEPDSVVSARQLTKRFGEFTAVDSLPCAG